MRPNVFAGPHVDRLKFANADAESVARAIAEGSARLIPVWKSRCPVVRLPSPTACLLPFDSGPFAGIDVNELILLGEYQGLAIFTTEFEGEAPPALENGAEFADLRLAAALLPHEEAGLVAYARAMISFRHRHRFCGSCGAPTAPQQNGRVMVCQRKGCETESFPRVDPAVIVLVTDGDRALLGRQPDWPAGRYSTIAGFVEPGESLEDAVRREVLEETGIETGAMIYQSSQPWPFPRSLMLGFRAEALSTEIRLRDRELEDARWFHRDELKGGSMMPFSQSIAYRLIQEWLSPLSILLSVATGLALAAAAGFRAFVPLLAAGLAIHFGYVEPARGFDWLGDPVVLAALSVATVTEIAAYYIPGVDHALDLIGAPVAIGAGIVAAAGVMVGLPEWLRWFTAIGAGGAVATAGHALNAVGRAKTGAVSGGLGNPVYATAELAGSALLSSLAFLLPAVAFAAILGCGAWALQRWRRRRV